MRQTLLSPKEMNVLYTSWASSLDPILYDNLIRAVMDNTYIRFWRDGEDVADAIAAIVGSKLYRALPGYIGPLPLKTYDPARGSFHAFQATMARTTRLDYLKRRTANGIGEKRISYTSSEEHIELLHYDGNSKRRK